MHIYKTKCSQSEDPVYLIVQYLSFVRKRPLNLICIVICSLGVSALMENSNFFVWWPCFFSELRVIRLTAPIRKRSRALVFCLLLPTHLYFRRGLWRSLVPWDCQRGRRRLLPGCPATWWLRASALCCSCPARISRPPVEGGYPLCPLWPVSVNMRQMQLSSTSVNKQVSSLTDGRNCVWEHKAVTCKRWVRKDKMTQSSVC